MTTIHFTMVTILRLSHVTPISTTISYWFFCDFFFVATNDFLINLSRYYTMGTNTSERLATKGVQKVRGKVPLFLFCKSAELNYYSFLDKHDLYLYSKFCCSGMNTMLTVIAMETVHHDYRPTFVHFCKKWMFNDDVASDAFFTKLCMSKVQYVCGEHMMSYKCVTSFGRKTAIFFSGYA